MNTLKALTLALLLCTAAPAFADSVPVASPTIQQVTGATCTADELLPSVVTGFSADGNYVTSLARGYVACGHSGRGTNYVYFRWCGTLRFALAGNFVDFTPFNPTPANPHGFQSTQCNAIPADPSATYTNAGGYEAYSVPGEPFPYFNNPFYPALQTP